MLTKERLEELIEQEAMIYTITVNNRLDYFRLKKDWYVMNDELWEYKLSKLSFRHWWIDNLYENKEDAEWIIEFGCIERTERLELPTWEEFSKWDKLVKFSNNGTKYSMYVFIKNKNTNNCRIIIYADDGEQDWLVFEQPLTKENYTLACRKVKELFLGEKK